MRLDDFLNFASSKTTSTNLNCLLLAINERLHLYQVRFPNPSCCIMCMADIVAANCTFSTYIAFTSHYIPTFCLYTGSVTYQNSYFM
jgi:hypothetical protein